MRTAGIAATLILLGFSLSGCAVVSVASTAVSITSTVVGTAADVTGDVVSGVADTVGGSDDDKDKDKKNPG
ncbi:MAG TPA: hypothetical protein VHU87_03625 [Rhizomicrobium sp.]|jgi:hypothetical protein|nr:hypothetical protein [Rhizomicrobium sp.]